MAGTELAKAYVQIVPSAKGIKGKLSEAMNGEAGPAGQSFGGKMVGAIKAVVATAAIGKAISASINEGAALQQSIGGIDTLFKDSAEKVKQNAANAYRTAGMSANEYMEMTTSFSASLLQSLGNDTSKAADAADMAMTDMSDNANKMGSDMDGIKNAYQGFAKQNYTMLDNLKLGYGGTKTEMARLLADAQKVSGVKYDINNLADVYSAIHVVQGELDITGTTAKEASSTFSGSMAAMKASFKNLLGNLSIGADIGPALSALQETVGTFITGNLLPMLGNILSALPQLMGNVVDAIVESLNFISSNSDQIATQGIEYVATLAAGIVTNLPALLGAAWNMVMSLGSAIINADWGTITQNLISNIKTGLDSAAGQMLGTNGSIIDAIGSSIMLNLPIILNKGVEIVSNLINGILSNIPSIITTAGTMITNFVSGVYQMLPSVLSAGAKLILNIVNGIISNLPSIISSAINVITKFIATIGQKAPQIIQSGLEIIAKLAAGLIQAIPSLVAKIPQIITSIKNAFINTDWLSIGINIIKGIANGLVNAAGMLWNAVKGVLGNFKDQVLSFFGIHSPSTWGIFVGNMIDQGIANGIVGNLNPVMDAVSKMQDTVAGPFGANVELTGYSRGGNEYNNLLMSKFDACLRILYELASSNKELKVMLNNREFMRLLKEEGVVFI